MEFHVLFYIKWYEIQVYIQLKKIREHEFQQYELFQSKVVGLNITIDKKNRVWVTTRILRRKVSAINFFTSVRVSLYEIQTRIENSKFFRI